jgi:hypothetical protein
MLSMRAVLDELVGAEPVIHGDDLRRCLTVVVEHDRQSWRYDCSI